MVAKFKRKWKLWKGPVFSRAGSLLLLVAGLITFTAGYGAWKSPHLDWEGFIQSLQVLGLWGANEVVRMISDPFAFIGLIVMIVGVLAIANGVRRFLQSF
jgi:hypothetical protein